MASKKDSEDTLEDIKRLLMLLLVKLDTPLEELAIALRKKAISSVSDMMPVRKIKKFSKRES
jgi:hypothetical protein